MTTEEIESEITQLHADVLAVLQGATDERVIDKAITHGLRAAFSIGADNGKAVILAAVDSMIAPRVAVAAESSIAKSLGIVERWCQGKTPGEPLRSYTSGPTVMTDRGKQWRVTRYGGMTAGHFFGVDQTDAMAQFAQWCEGDMTK